jgi:hypothetical protein
VRHVATAPGYECNLGDRPNETIVLPFPKDGGEFEEAECLPATASCSCVDRDQNVGLVALSVGDVGIYAPCEPKMLRTMAAAYLAMADEIDGGAGRQ